MLVSFTWETNPYEPQAPISTLAAAGERLFCSTRFWRQAPLIITTTHSHHHNNSFRTANLYASAIRLDNSNSLIPVRSQKSQSYSRNATRHYARLRRRWRQTVPCRSAKQIARRINIYSTWERKEGRCYIIRNMESSNIGIGKLV